MTSIITGIFKKTKSAKQVVEALIENLDNLPSESKIKELVEKKVLQNAGASNPSSNRSIGESIPPGQEAGLGVADGLSPQELNALDGFQKRLSEIRIMLTGTADVGPKEEEVLVLANQLIKSNIPMRICASLKIATFEARKDIVHILNFLLSYDKIQVDKYPSAQDPEKVAMTRETADLTTIISQYFKANATPLIHVLLHGYSQPNLALHCGAIMRQCLLHKNLYEECLKPDVLNMFFSDFLHSESFDVCSDAFATFRDILSKQKQLVSAFLEEKYEFFFPQYNKLLQSDMQYVTQRQSLKLLSELLLDRQNYKTMMRYIGEKANLILIMNLMRVKSPAMRLEAFHVFKIFVANPNKTEAVTQILAKNKTKLIAYLANFTTEREDATFNSERQLLITTLESLQDPTGKS